MSNTIYEKIEVEPDFFMIKRIDEDSKEWWIPLSEGNSDYQAYLAEQVKPTK